jgi:hypothetical protein
MTINDRTFMKMRQTKSVPQPCSCVVSSEWLPGFTETFNTSFVASTGESTSLITSELGEVIAVI